MKSTSTSLTLFSFLFIILSLKFVVASLTLERIDSIADLCGIAVKHLSDSPYEAFDSTDVNIMNEFAWSVSEMWNENESALYVLTRLAKLADERDEEGNFTPPARVIRSFSQQSDARKIYMTTMAGSDEPNSFGDGASLYESRKKNSVDDEIEKMYLKGMTVEADARLSKLIQKRWDTMQEAIKDIESSAKKGNFNVLSGFIRIGSKHRALKFIAPELKAGLGAKLLSLKRVQLDPTSSKWLLSIDTYREDQLKLVKLLEKYVKRHGIMTQNYLRLHQKNSLVQLFNEIADVIRVGGKEEFSSNYFNDVDSVDGQSVSGKYEQFYKKMDTKSIKNEEEEEEISDHKVNPFIEDVFDLEANYKKSSSAATNKTSAEDDSKSPSVPKASNDQTSAGENYFEEKQKREEEIDKLIYENNTDPLYDDDGVYDQEEQKRDRKAWIVIAILMGLIVLMAITSYVYLRIRRANRNRTMLVVNGALEGIPATATA